MLTSDADGDIPVSKKKILFQLEVARRNYPRHLILSAPTRFLITLF